MKSVYLEGKSIYTIVKKVEKCFLQEKLKDNNTLIINIEESQNNDLPIKDDFLYKKYFIDLDKRWSKDNNDWCFSYYRRLIENRAGISQLEQAIEAMSSDPSTRRCVLCANDPLDNGQYRPSLVAVTFVIRENKLDMIVHWRSQEIFYALPINIITMYSFARVFFERIKGFNESIEFGEYIQYVDSVVIHENINKNMTQIQSLWQNISPSLEKELCFMWSVLKKNQEEFYDENYQKKRGMVLPLMRV